MIVCETEFFKSFAEKEMLMQKLKRMYDHVKFSFDDNIIIYQYNDGKKDK